MTERPRWHIRQVAKQGQQQQDRRAKGLCVTCGEDGEGYARCAVCRIKNRQSVQRAKTRQEVNGRCGVDGDNSWRTIWPMSDTR